MLSISERIVLGATGGAVALALMAFFPAGTFFSYASTLGLLNQLVPELLVVVLGGAAVAGVWPLLKAAPRYVLVIALLAFGYFFGFPAFTALGFIGLVASLAISIRLRMRLPAPVSAGEKRK